jgi:hypothetical protein
MALTLCKPAKQHQAITIGYIVTGIPHFFLADSLLIRPNHVDELFWPINEAYKNDWQTLPTQKHNLRL